jgi:post-segregation antitoxin (ccd killing protein)
VLTVKNITLSVDDETLEAAREVARDRSTTINGLVRAYLETLAEERRLQRDREAREALAELSERTTLSMPADWSWNRNDIYDR